MEKKSKNNSISEDFPLYHNEKVPIYRPLNIIHHQKNFSIKRITYSNEHPDLFRLKGMKEGGYINPYFKNIKSIDREEYIKKIENSKKKIKYIDFIKSDRKYSQDPKLLSLIKNDYYIRRKKIENIMSNELSPKNYYSLSSDNKILFNQALRKLNQSSEKVTKDILKQNIDTSKLEKISGNFLISKDDVGKIKKISSTFDINNSSYIGNYNDFKISEVQNKDFNKEFNYPRKPLLIYNPIKNERQTLYPPPYKFQKWGDFYENHFILSNIKNGFNKKGGLFSEFIKKNIDKLKVMKMDARERLKYQKENYSTQKEKILDNNGYNQNYDNRQFILNNIKFHSLTPSNSVGNVLSPKKFKEIFFGNKI